MEEKEKTITDQTADQDTNKQIKLKKKKRWPLVLLVLLLFIAGTGYYLYSQGYFNKPAEEETTIEKENKETDTTKTVANKVEEELKTLNGSWASDNEDFLTEFTITSPDVVFANGLKAKLSKSTDSKYQYMITLGPENEGVDYPIVFCIDSFKGNEARLWIPENDGQYIDSVIIKRSTTEVIEGNDTNGNSNTTSSTSSKPQTNTTPANTNSGSTNTSSGNNSSNTGSSSNNQGSQKGHWEERTVLVREAWDEKVVTKPAWTEQVLIREAWVEEDTYCAAFGQDKVMIYVCNQCGAKFYSGGDANNHISGSQTCGGWHNDYELQGEPHCLEYKTDYINHPAEYNYIYHPEEYTMVHHDAEYRTERVWVND